MNRLENKVAIITGAAGGMGAVEAKLLAEEIANGVLFLASDESSYITELELAIDGGFTAL